MRYSSLLLAIFAVIVSVRAQGLTFNTSTCVEPARFRSCWTNVTAQAQQCIRTTCPAENGTCSDPATCTVTEDRCVKKCVCAAYTQWINCAASHCWNRAYSCAYQALAIQALEKCTVAERFPPFWPPPVGYRGRGACNCHIGEAYRAVRGYAEDRASCNTNINRLTPSLAAGQNVTYHKQCDCCAWDGQLNALTQFCPRLEKKVPFWGSLAPLINLSSRYSSRCATVLPSVFAAASSTCAATPIGITLNATTAASKAHTTFSPVTLTITTSVPVMMMKRQDNNDDDLSDDGSLDAPPSGSVFTWSLVSDIPATATAAAAVAASGSGAAATSSSFAMARSGNMFLAPQLFGAGSGLAACVVFGVATGVLAFAL